MNERKNTQPCSKPEGFKRKDPARLAATKKQEDRQGNVRQRNEEEEKLFIIPLPNIPLPMFSQQAIPAKAIVRGMIVRGIKATHFLFFIPLTIIPLTNLLIFSKMNDFSALHYG